MEKQLDGKRLDDPSAIRMFALWDTHEDGWVEFAGNHVWATWDSLVRSIERHRGMYGGYGAVDQEKLKKIVPPWVFGG